ncbi:MAG: alpha/beta hydrolase, partial [Chloroflexota bacterium]|nr:alpha/beta hydrolase [Chloroflexota bacterium]
HGPAGGGGQGRREVTERTSPPEERDVAVNGIALRVATWGRLVDPERAVLLVHGITANNRVWFELGPFLAAQGWFVVAPDLRGRGKSAKPPHGYGLPFHADDLLALGDALGLARTHLVGHSLGALVGLYLAAVHPARLRKLVLVDAGGRLPPDTYEAIAPALARLGETHPSLDAYLAAMRETTRLPWEGIGERYYRHDAEVRPDGTATSGVPTGAIAEEQAAILFTRTDALPGAVRAPTLIVRATEGLLGGERGLILPRAEAESLLGEIAGSRLVEISGTDHYTVVLAETFGQEVAAFLGEGTHDAS